MKYRNNARTLPVILLGLLLLLSACSKEAVTDPKGLAAATSGCFQASLSHARNQFPRDTEKADRDFQQELYPCLAWNILGKNATQTEKKGLADTLEAGCPFLGMAHTDKKKMIWCLMGVAAPIVQTNLTHPNPG